MPLRSDDDRIRAPNLAHAWLHIDFRAETLESHKLVALAMHGKLTDLAAESLVHEAPETAHQWKN